MSPAVQPAPFYEGKAKRLYRLSESEILHEFKNSATAFNGQKKADFEGKGEMNSKISAALFKFLESRGIKTHFLRWQAPASLVTQKLKMIPVELVVRNVVAGSLAKRLGLEEGRPIEPPLVEWFLKNDSQGDPQVSEGILVALFDQNPERLNQMKVIALLVNQVLGELFARAQLRLVDFKLEFGVDAHHQIILGDEISPDTCRLWDLESQEKLDKDRFRFDLGDLMIGYREVWRRLQSALPPTE
jgi:phosphoribosylaminoimidazole-succinocarboxamide synthase